jgi:hypothetical protein
VMRTDAQLRLRGRIDFAHPTAWHARNARSLAMLCQP